MAIYILVNTAFQLIALVGAVWLVGFLISLINKSFYGMFRNSHIICYATGLIGTPVHELSHALFCIVFAHKVTKIKLFQIDPESGVLGYVEHAYRRRNLYERVGDYFIGIAPIIGNLLCIFLFMWLLLPQMPDAIFETVNQFVLAGGEGLGRVGDGAIMVLNVFAIVFKGITEGFPWWIFMLLAFCLALHMNLSGQDIKLSLPGCALFVGVLVAVNLILGFALFDIYKRFALFMTTACTYVIVVLVMSLLFSLIVLLIGLAVKGVLLLFRRR